MGNCNNKPPPTAAKSKLPKKELTFGKDPSLNIADFTLSNAESIDLVKYDLKGQQFLIDTIKNCNVYLLDTLAALTVDECHNSLVVTGPVQSSTFIRNSTNSTFILPTTQFRTRDCKNCTFFLYANTAPIIESSRNLRFACYPASWFSFSKQLSEGAKVSVWNNKWFDVYDFTPSDGAGNFDSTNWKALENELDLSEDRMLTAEIKSKGFKTLKGVDPAADERLGFSFDAAARTIPLTIGTQAAARLPSTSSCLLCLVLPRSSYEMISNFILELQKAPTQRISMVRARLIALDKDMCRLVFKTIDPKSLVSITKACANELGTKKGVKQQRIETLAIEFRAHDNSPETVSAGSKLKQVMEREMGAAGPGVEGKAGVWWANDGDEAEETCRSIFEFWKEEQ